MGFESRLYVVNKTDVKRDIDGKKMFWGEVIAVFNLCVVDRAAAKFNSYAETDVCIISEDGNKMITEDRYGRPLREIPIMDAVKILEEVARQDTYRRYAPCIQMLKGFTPSRWDELVVLHYGY